MWPLWLFWHHMNIGEPSLTLDLSNTVRLWSESESSVLMTHTCIFKNKKFSVIVCLCGTYNVFLSVKRLLLKADTSPEEAIFRVKHVRIHHYTAIKYGPQKPSHICILFLYGCTIFKLLSKINFLKKLSA